MNDNQATLESFFGFSQSLTPGSEEYEQLLANLPMDHISETKGKLQKNPAIPIAAGALLNAIASLLDIPLWDIIERAWTGGHLFEKYFDPENYDPDELISIVLKDHELTSEHQPAIDLMLNGNKVGSISFQLAVTLMLEGVILNIRGGQVAEIQAGRIQGSAILECEGQTLFTRETEKKDLPGTIRFPAKDKSSGVNP